MPVMAKCGECGKQFRIRDELAGKVLPCKACGAEFRVPAPGGRRPQRQPAATAPRRRQREEDFFEDDVDSGGSSATLWIIGGSAVGVILLGVAIAIFVFAGKKDGDDGDAKDNADKVAQNDGDADPPLGDGNPPIDPGVNNPGVNNPGVNNPPDNHPPVANPGVGKPVAKNNGGGGLQPPVGGNNPPDFGGNLPRPGVARPGGIVPPGAEKKAVFDKSAPVQWSMKVDPPPEPIEFAGKDRLMLRSPKSFWANAIYPSSSNAVAAIGSNHSTKDFRDVYDLRTGRQIGKIGGIDLGFARSMALSPSGWHFAAITNKTNGIWLWDVKAKRQLGTLPIDEKYARAGRLDILDFAGPNRVVAKGNESPLWVWSHPFDKPATTIEMPKWHEFQKESVAFSHGGNYMTYYHKKDKDIVAHNLATGKEAGRIMIPKDISLSGCKGMAFSQDGKEFAALFQFIRKTRLFVWDVATGKQLAHHQFELQRGHYKGPAIQWFPDKSKWLLLGNTVVDRTAGKPVWQVPKIPDAKDEARLLGADRIALFGQTRGVPALATLPVPHEAIAKATKVVQSGGTTADVNLPELKPADWNTARVVAADGVAGGWRVVPDSAPAGNLPGGAVNIDTTFGRVTGVAIARRDVGRAVTLSEAGSASTPVSRRAARFGGQKQPAQNGAPVARLDLYDLKNRNRADTLPLTYKCDLMAVSPSGAHALVRYKTGEDRLDVWSLGEKKHVVGWKPYITEKSKYHHKVIEAMFVDEEHVLTINSNNRLAVWKLPEAKAVFAINGIRKPSLSPNGKYVSGIATRSFRFFNARTGAPAGDITLGTGTAMGGAFHPDGQRFAGLFMTAAGLKLAVWSMKTGAVETEFPIPRIPASGKLHWCGDGHVLIDQTRLVDLNSKMIVWTYSLRGTHVEESPDGKHWYLSGTRPMTLTGLTMPDATAKRQLDGKKLAPNYILKPGMSVALNIQLNGVQGQGNINTEVYNAWKQKLEAAGVKVVAKAPLVLFARADSQDTGKTATFTISQSRFGMIPPPRFGGRFGQGGTAGGNSRTETVTDSVINCRIVFGQGAKAYGEVKRPIHKLPGSSGYYRASIKKGETADSHFSSRQQRSAAAFFKSYTPPAYLFDNASAAGIGSSQLVAGGSR